MTVLFFLVLLVAVAVLAYLGFIVVGLGKKNAQLNSDLHAQRTKYDQDLEKWTKYCAALKNENKRLSRWKGVADAAAKATELIRTGQATLKGARAKAKEAILTAQQQASELVANANTQASETVSDAKEKAKGLTEETQAILDSATAKSAEILDVANKRAEEIGGSAYDALKNASLYERTVKAMKNTIKGYGDRYLIPGHALLDDLAGDFSHTDGGRELKRAREHTRIMIQNGTAATCDYVEASRRETAINFAIDAFNGKVESILSRVKHSNAGTLRQEIKDAFTLVNYNGKAFRDARIAEEYLSARLDELKWAAIVQQLKLEEREEQRRIKAQIREEERARKEYERAMRDAAKEEEVLRRAMEKAQQQIQQATAEQRAKYEHQLEELTQKLSDAEERNQRAISMAQQTKRGHVYIISNMGSFGENVLKIGLTRRLEPLDRVRELGDSSVPFEFDVHAMIFSEDAPALEAQLHKHFVMTQMNKVNHRKEFFRVEIKHIREEIERLGIAAKWTMVSQATEYRETLAIEKAMSESPETREAWAKRQLELQPAAIELTKPTDAT